MGNVLYELNFDWRESFGLITPLVLSLMSFFIYKWYPAQNPGVDRKGYKGYVFAKWMGWIVGVFVFCLFILITAAHITDYQEKIDILQNNQAKVVEGIVEKYHAMPREGHDSEHFEINGIYFEYSNFETINGYNTPACRGGVIKENGQHLKIKYVEEEFENNVILYIEEIK